jgi:hypothetical protein
MTDWDSLDDGKYRDEAAVIADLLAAQPLSAKTAPPSAPRPRPWCAAPAAASASRAWSKASCRSSASAPARAWP